MVELKTSKKRFSSEENRIAVVIPTINRKDKLKNCLENLRNQTYKDFQVYVVNNGSTDGTEQMLRKVFPDVIALNYQEMLGSAGGYKVGLEKAYKDGFDWFWLMDDDVLTEKNSLDYLIKDSGFDSSKVFASVGLDERRTGDLAWSNDLLINAKKENAKRYSDLGKEDLVESAGIGYLGLFFARRIIEKIGYPDERMFAWVDDVDYYLRIKSAGFRMFYVRNSIVYHPKADYQEINILFKKIGLARSQPWKEYYFIRNSLYLWLKYNSRLKIIFLKLPKQILLYIIVWLFYSDEKIKRLKYYSLAFYDGLVSKMGLTVLPEK